MISFYFSISSPSFWTILKIFYLKFLLFFSFGRFFNDFLFLFYTFQATFRLVFLQLKLIDIYISLSVNYLATFQSNTAVITLII